MASADVYKRCATLNWEIENFDLLLEMASTVEGGCFQSPVWKVEQNGGNIWCVLYIGHENRRIWFNMRQLQENSVNYRCDASIFSSCGEVPLKILCDDSLFFFEKDDVFGEKKQSILPSNALTLRLKIRGETMKNQELCICSALHRIQYLWNIQPFNSSRSYNTFIEQDNFLLDVALNAKSKDGNSMAVEIAPNAERCVFFVDCAFSITNGCELITNKTLHSRIFNYVKWTCDIEKFLENKERINVQFRWIVSLHKVCKNVKHENASEAVSGPTSARADDFLLLYREGTLSDATLNTEGKSFSTHRSILAARSPVFRAMFEKDEMSEGRSGVVDIDDVDSETMDRMLVFLYGEKLDDVRWEDALALYYAADKYGVLSLKQRCVDILKAGLAVDNACDVLVLADKQSDEQLKKYVVDYISNHRKVFSSSKWEKLEDSNPRLTTKIIREVYVKKEK